ncbi:Ubiquinone/menaquinone biosynthesis methyltransferase UbiE [Caenispirillum salinarum AK4]|uniref:Ubiquinone/menaquinone biosynthesis C-methyltransferase UbiE n=1 Tax=Caenispirillum salinarum AK4 TaxID=1238182 RepID=K9HNJ9_9PROT|nr:bifunctional demethylmenaquinone methyltransferase/2-methoxy-6-polyprenyl-1,4-benzoquinol methylase UbiE [Caenispirillum salinarum]EKV31908.1 Ubiquinone/menaquinone biosynthesis methyltransferase UbiE [Caenispirillum salinarum AK4]
MSQQNDTTHFGFRTVRTEEKQGLVRDVFDSVAARYDLMNDLMSGGVHRIWKNALIDWVNPQPGQALLDVAGGTGDIAFRFLDRARHIGAVRRAERRDMGEDVDEPPPNTAEAAVTVCDINVEMLKVGRDRATDQGRLSGLTWACGNAESLPFPDRTFDHYTIAFGLRNVTNIDLALAEARRVLKPGGRFFCLEFSKVVVPGLDAAYDLYSFKVLPRMGQIVARNREAYQYLAESIRKFPPQDRLVEMMEEAGLRQSKYRNLSGGIACIHSGWRI